MSSDADLCAICVETVDADPHRRLLCGHVFHSDCIGHWTTRGESDANLRCPTCRCVVIDDNGCHPLQPRNRQGQRQGRCFALLDFTSGGHAGITATGERPDRVVVAALHPTDVAGRSGLHIGTRLLEVNRMRVQHHAHAIEMIEALAQRRRCCAILVESPRSVRRLALNLASSVVCAWARTRAIVVSGFRL